MLAELAGRFTRGDTRALAQAITVVERGGPRAPELLARLRDAAGEPPPAVGFTGAPGAGKSTLVDAMIREARGRDATVGVVAVDPSSPYSGGAVLGDRLRMDAHLLDPGVYVRSMGARGHLGGLSSTAGEVVWLLGAFGFDEVLVETVGTGQSEHDVPSIVDTTVVVLTPGMGDGVQLEKAGIMEIADVFAVNKADLPGAPTVVRELRTMLNMGPRNAWRPPIVPTVANRPDPSPAALWEAIGVHREHLAESEAGRESTASRLKDRTAAIVAEHARAAARARLDADEALTAGLMADRLPRLAAEQLLSGTTQWYDAPAMWDTVRVPGEGKT
jgi:LAO/AO transport system kinase